MDKLSQQTLAKFLIAKRAWGRRWAEIYDDDGHKNATVTDRLILDTIEDDDLEIARIEWELQYTKLKPSNF